MLRYLVLFGGIVLMITGCNSLVSQQFGTHRLRTLPAGGATATDVGEADFVRITGVNPAGPTLGGGDADRWGDYVRFVPLLTPAQEAERRANGRVTTGLVGWFKTTDPARQRPAAAAESSAVTGLVNPPAARYVSTVDWSAAGVSLAEPVVYVQIGERPLAWYYNLLLMLVGVLLAVVPEFLGARRRGVR